MKSNKLSVILTPKSIGELEQDIIRLKSILKDINHDVVAVVSPYDEGDYEWLEDTELLFLEVPEELSITKKRNIGVCAMAHDTTTILFTETTSSLNAQTVKKYTDFFIEPLIGAVGSKGGVLNEFDYKKLLHETITKFNVDEKIFKERCCGQDGQINYITPDYFLASVKVWDLVGGLNTKAELPYVEYCIRVQALGYTILPF